MDELIKQFLSNGGIIKQLPAINKPTDRSKLNQKRSRPKPKKPTKIKSLHPALCQQCQDDNGPANKRCLKCQHYKQFDLNNQIKDKIAFEHLPQSILENVADLPHGEEVITKIRQLPLDKSVPLMMQYVLNASNQEMAKYLKMSPQGVSKKNKLSLEILKTSLK